MILCQGTKHFHGIMVYHNDPRIWPNNKFKLFRRINRTVHNIVIADNTKLHLFRGFARNTILMAGLITRFIPIQGAYQLPGNRLLRFHRPPVLTDKRIQGKREANLFKRRDKRKRYRRYVGEKGARVGAARKVANTYTPAQLDRMAKKMITAAQYRPKRWYQRLAVFLSKSFKS